MHKSTLYMLLIYNKFNRNILLIVQCNKYSLHVYISACLFYIYATQSRNAECAIVQNLHDMNINKDKRYELKTM